MSAGADHAPGTDYTDPRNGMVIGTPSVWLNCLTIGGAKPGSWVIFHGTVDGSGTIETVGSGAFGCQIADELLQAGRRVFLSISRHRRVPRRFRGKDVYWWLEKLGRFDQTIDTWGFNFGRSILSCGRFGPATLDPTDPMSRSNTTL